MRASYSVPFRGSSAIPFGRSEASGRVTLRRRIGDVLFKLSLKALSLGLERGCRLAVTLAAAPVLGEAAFGELVFASTLTAILALAAELGLGVWTTRSLARGSHDSASTVRVGMAIRGATTIPYATAVTLAAIFAGRETRAAIAWLGVAALCNSFLDQAGAILRGSERFADETRLNFVRGVLILAAGLGALAFQPSLTRLCVAMTVASAAALAWGIAILARAHSGLARAALDRSLVRIALRQATPIWLAGLLSLVYFKVDTFFVRFFAGDTELGAYGAAYKLFEGAMLLPAVVLAVTFPRLARAHDDHVARRILERRIGGALLGLGLAVGAVFFFARGALIDVIFRARFHRAEDSLRVLALGVPLVYVNFGLTHFLVARDRERVNTALALMMLAVTVTLDILLVPSGSGPGAAWATVLAEVALTVSCIGALVSESGAHPKSSQGPAASSRARTTA
jgi:O-antigen/teichoic acid export membrane protein